MLDVVILDDFVDLLVPANTVEPSNARVATFPLWNCGASHQNQMSRWSIQPKPDDDQNVDELGLDSFNETINRSKGTLIAYEDKVNLLNSWLAGPFNFRPGDKQKPEWTIANDNWEIMLKNVQPSGIDVSEVDKVMPLT